MKNPEKILKSVQICKSERQKARESGNGGTNWPGKMAKEAYPDILNCVFEDLDEICCVIGTNGKTTTCRMIDNILNFVGIDHIYNREGANLPEGLLTTLLLNYDDYGVPVKKKALLECDEITFRDLSSVMSPKIIVITNLYPDEEFTLLSNVETVTEFLIDAIRKCPDAVLCLNGENVPCLRIAEAVPNRKIVYSAENDTAYVDGKPFPIGSVLHSHAYTSDAAAACAFAYAYGLNDDTAVSAVRETVLPFGRMEIQQKGQYTVIFEMIKNVAGIRAFLDYATEKGISGILIMSVWDYAPQYTEWMEHTDFTQLFSLFDEIYTSGPCITAKTFLRYPGVLWLEEKDISEKIYSTAQNVTILTDYFGNIGIHKLLSKEGHLRQFWEE